MMADGACIVGWEALRLAGKGCKAYSARRKRVNEIRTLKAQRRAYEKVAGKDRNIKRRNHGSR